MLRKDSAEQEVTTPEVAKALLEYKAMLDHYTWGELERTYHRARKSFSPSLSLGIAEKHVLKRAHSRPAPKA